MNSAWTNLGYLNCSVVSRLPSGDTLSATMVASMVMLRFLPVVQRLLDVRS